MTTIRPTRLTAILAVALALAPLTAVRADTGPDPRAASAKKDSAKLADIKHLLALTGAANLGQQVMAQLIPSFKSSMPNVSEKFWQDFMKEADPNELVDMVALIYDKYLTHEEVKATIKFYETPAGRKLVSVLPQVTQESMLAGQNWGRQLGERIARRLQEQQKKGK